MQAVACALRGSRSISKQELGVFSGTNKILGLGHGLKRGAAEVRDDDEVPAGYF